MRYFRTEDNTGFKYIHSKDDKVIYIENETAEAPQFSLQYGDKLIQIFINDGVYRPERDIEGTSDLFSLSYISDSRDKGQSIFATEAEINIYEDDFFNIDELKTASETEILIKYFEKGSLIWSGFVLPDFFQTGITNVRILKMVASDRIATLKETSNQTVSDTPIKIIAEALKNTGLDLGINVIAKNDFLQTITIERERIKDISSYDLIRTFMILFNCKIVQYSNKWWIINKSKLESGYIDYKSYTSEGTFINSVAFNQKIIPFNQVDTNGERSIRPTASEVSLFLEFGGSKKYPDNWDFEKLDEIESKFDNWTNYNGFEQGYRRHEILFYSYIDGYYNAVFSFAGVEGAKTENTSLWYRRYWYSNKISDNIFEYSNLRSDFVTIPTQDSRVEISLSGNFTTRDGNPVSVVPVIRNITKNKYFVYNADGEVVEAGNGSLFLDVSNFDEYVHSPRSSTEDGFNFDDLTHKVVDVNWDVRKTFDVSSFGSYNDKLEIQVVFIGGVYLPGALDLGIDIFINSVQISFNDSQDFGKGLIFKIKQGAGKFSKSREPETVLFSDKINQGVNGYFYNYKYDDTSIVGLPEEFALASVRERALMFSQARDYLSLSGKIEVNPIAKYTCKDKSFVLVGGESRRKDSSIEIEEIVIQSLELTDYIYTYFDEGKDKVKNIKGVGSAGSGGGSSSSGGVSLIKIDDEGNYYVEESFYSLKNVSAYGLGDEGGSGGGVIDIVDNLTSNESNKALSARQGMILDNKISNIEVGEGGQVVVDWDAILAKPTTFPPAPHAHVIADVTGLQDALDLKANLADLDSKENTFTKKTAFNKNFGTGLNDVARGNHTHAFSELEATPTTLQGYGITDATSVSEFELHKDNISNPHSVTKAQVGLSNVDNVKQAPKDEFDSFKQLFDSLFEVDEDGNIKALKTFYSVGNVSAYGLGDSGLGSGSIDVINNLISTSTNQALSANQGRILNINKADKTEVSALATDKVDKVEGKSLIADSEILRLANVTNQDLTPYETTSNVNTKLNTKVDKVTGKSLISDSEITRLSSVTNQDLTPYEKTSDVNTKLNNKVDKVANKSLILDSEITRLASVTNQTKVSLGLDLVANKNLSNVDNIQQASKVNFDAHTANKLNPHAVTKDQVGLGNVSNVLQASKNEFDSNKSTTDTHIANKLNPHSVTAFQVGLGNVTNNLQATKAEFDNFVTLFNQMFEIDGDVIKAKKTLYSVGNISAYGQGTGGTGGAFDMIYNGLDSSVTDVAGSANNDFVLNNKITALENRTFTSISGSVEYQEINII